jgi:hypothetical protein
MLEKTCMTLPKQYGMVVSGQASLHDLSGNHYNSRTISPLRMRFLLLVKMIKIFTPTSDKQTINLLSSKWCCI